ncbi:PhaM family polyhydroxyalkanoate granule multifunctional regulatory protein [uncultured Hydrogenophaga sp.]|uniref:PhaM family polyhydroxyalkanoate granule multifunctional regulatory protein n=1 Tax=uncultured Hydrogenophaga sp. TaxID=199683 RepID=UPI00265D90D7|nr:PhaM family polyhydroxyalkanoate granule multifunctional regulatory protein [uncultured Hydrogenophaga sp.]
MSENTGGFGKFVPGFDFLQSLAGQAAGGIAQGIGQNIPQLPNLSHWVAPTFNVEDLEKRIEELKAVHFWLDQNAKALGATIQALEVQKMTLSTLQTMNFSMGDVANAFKLKAADSLASFTPAATPRDTPAERAPKKVYEGLQARPTPAARKAPARKTAARKADAPAGGVVDPMQWWGALSQQFQQIATNAVKDAARQGALQTTRDVAAGLTDQAVKTAVGAGKAAGRAALKAVKPAAPAARAGSRSSPRRRSTG